MDITLQYIWGHVKTTLPYKKQQLIENSAFRKLNMGMVTPNQLVTAC